MPKTKHSPVKLLLDLGIDVMNLSSQEDYKSALIEGLAKLQYTGETASERFKILADEVRRVKTEQEKAKDPTYTTKEERPPITADKFLGRKDKSNKASPVSSSAIVPSPGGDLAKPEDVTKTEGVGKKEEIMNPLQKLLDGVNGIFNTLRKGNKADKKASDDARKEAEKARRKKREGELEKMVGPVSKAADKVLKPVKNIFAKIFGFLATIILGNVAMKIWSWFGDPKNSEKVASIFRFLKDWWPAIVAGLIAFASPLLGPAGVIAGIVALVIWGIPKIQEAIEWVKGLFGIGVDKELKSIDDSGNKLSDDLNKSADDLEGKMEDDLTKDAEGLDPSKPVQTGTPEETRGGGRSMPNTKVEGDTKLEQAGQEVQNQAKGIEEPPVLNMFAGGGQVSGSGSGDTVPAMLTPGEFVMSKGAVQQYGSDTLAGMNAAAGGTNRPTVGRYQGGGSVRNVSNKNVNNSVRNGFNKNVNNSVRNVSSKNVTNNVVGGDGPTIHYASGGPVSSSVSNVINSIRGGNFLNSSQTIISKRPLHFAGGGEVPSFISKRPLHFAGGGEVPSAQIAKGGPSLAPISPPSKSSTTVTYRKGTGAQEVRSAAAESPGQELPNFNAAARRSGSKIKTLGIVV